MLKKITLVLIAILAALAGYVAMQPSQFRVERTASIAAPQAAVFSQVNNLRNWDGWSPWAKLDPNAKVTFEGPAEGPGAAFKWSGNEKIGEGAMTLTDSRPNEHVGLKVDFVKPFEGTSRSEFDFKPDGNATAVTWRTTGEHNFAGKAMCLIMNGEKMMGGELEKGLAKLKAVAEGAPAR